MDFKKIKKFFFLETKSIAKAGFLLTFLSFLSAILGVFRDALLASIFGASKELDIYFASFRIPDFLYSILIFGAISAAFIPLFNQLLKENREKAFLFSNQFLKTILLILFSFSTILFFLVPLIVKKIIVPGFDLESQKKVIFLTRIMLIQPIFLGTSSVFGSILQSFERFLATGLAPIFYNFGIIIGILIFAKFWGINGVAYGVILGALLHFLLQFLIAKNLGFSFKLKFKKIVPFKKIFKLIGPRSLSLLSRQINLIIITALASTISYGAISIFNLAQNFAFFGANLFGVSFAVAAFPKLAQVAKTDKFSFKKIFNETFKKTFLILVFLTLFYLFFGKILIKLVLTHGKFIPSSNLTYQVLIIFSFGIIPWGLIPLLVRTFFALEDALTPFFIGIFSDLIFLILAFILTKKFQIYGLAFSFVFLCWIQFLLLNLFLKLKKK